jgi:ArsR family transcriptional regulator, arsenate/arsenite/antimonite-responsive transcriptional repressor
MAIDTLTDTSTTVNMCFMREIAVIDARCCPQVLASPLDDEASDRLAAALRVLADPARLRLLSLIGSHPNGEVCVCDLTASLGLSQPTVSHHLKVLADAGLVGREQRGRWVYYWLLPEPIELLRAALTRPELRPEDATEVAVG